MMNMLVWDCRGAGNKRFPGLIRDYIKMYNLCFLAVLEPRISGTRADNVINKLGFDGIARSNAIGFAGGVCASGRGIGLLSMLSLPLSTVFY